MLTVVLGLVRVCLRCGASRRRKRVLQITTVLLCFGTKAFGQFATVSTVPGVSTAAPRDVAVDGLGNVYIADSGNSRVQRISPAGLVTTVAGGAYGCAGDNGPALNAGLSDFYGLTVDGAGNIYIADYWCHSVRRVDAGTGIIARFAGSGIAGFSGSGGPATLANLQWPSDVAIGTNGTLYIADRHAVWQVNPLTGIITTIPS